MLALDSKDKTEWNYTAFKNFPLEKMISSPISMSIFNVTQIRFYFMIFPWVPLQEYNSNGIRSHRGSETQLTRTEYGHDTVSVSLTLALTNTPPIPKISRNKK